MGDLVVRPAREPYFTFSTKPDDGSFHFARLVPETAAITKPCNYGGPPRSLGHAITWPMLHLKT